MAVQGLNLRISKISGTTVAFGLAAVLALGLSLAAALVGLHARGSSSPAVPQKTAVDDLAARNARIAFFEARAAADPLDVVSLNVLASEYLQRARETGDVGDYQRAETAATTSLAILPGDNYGGIVDLASVRLVQHGFQEAATLADQAIALKPAGADGYGIRGDAYLNLGRYDEAGLDYQKALDIAPSLSAFSRLATLAFIQGNTVNAESFWQQSLALPDDASLPRENLAWARVQLGTVYFAEGRLSNAEEQYNLALGLFPNYVHALAGLASVKAAQGHLDDAATLYEQAQKLLPLPIYVIALGDVYNKAGIADKAENQYQLVDAIEKLYEANGINTDLQLALFYADHDRNLDEALSLGQAAYDASPSVYAADALAWALYKNGDLDEAAARSQEATRLGTPEASFYYHAGVIANAQGNKDEARTDLQKALQLNPYFSVLHSDDAKSLLAQLGGSK